MNNELPSYFRRGQGVVNRNDRQSPLAPFANELASRTYDPGAEALCIYHGYFLVAPTRKDHLKVRLNKGQVAK